MGGPTGSYACQTDYSELGGLPCSHSAVATVHQQSTVHFRSFRSLIRQLAIVAWRIEFTGGCVYQNPSLEIDASLYTGSTVATGLWQSSVHKMSFSPPIVPEIRKPVIATSRTDWTGFWEYQKYRLGAEAPVYDRSGVATAPWSSAVTEKSYRTTICTTSKTCNRDRKEPTRGQTTHWELPLVALRAEGQKFFVATPFQSSLGRLATIFHIHYGEK